MSLCDGVVMTRRLAQPPHRQWFAPLELLLSCPLSLALSEEISIDVSRGMVYHRRETDSFSEGLKSTTGPEVEVHYGPVSAMPSPPAN